MVTSRRFAVWVVVGVLGWGMAAAGSSAQQAVLPPAAIAPEEAAAVTEIWKMLAEGKANEVWERAQQLLVRYPRSPSVLATAIETDIAARGATAALSTYERWLGSRLEEPMVVRRMARAVLYEWSRQTAQSGAQTQALVALAEDGDAAAAGVIAAMHASGSESGLLAAARIQDPQAIAAILGRLKTPNSRRLADVMLLKESGSRMAVPALISVLGDPDPGIRAETALALGHIGDAIALPALQALLKDKNGVVRAAAASALFRFQDYSGAPILEALAAHESSSIRRQAAQLMAARPDDAWLNLVRSLINDPDPSVRLDAARMLEAHDPALARAIVESLSQVPDHAIREELELQRAGSSATSMRELRGLMAWARPLSRVRAAATILARTR